MSLIRIVALSILTLFLELLLIRWVGTELRVFAYLQNGVLVAAFLGLGLGARNARQPVRVWPSALGLLVVALTIRDPAGWQIGEAVTQGLGALEHSIVWNAGVEFPNYAMTALKLFAILVSFGILAALALIFIPLGQWLGRWMDAHPQPTAAYTANILGSLLGIGLFVLATALGTPPWSWLLAAALAYAAHLRFAEDGPRGRTAALALLLALPLTAIETGTTTVWSPYQKLSVSPFRPVGAPPEVGTCGELIQVNNTLYQAMFDLDPATQALRPALYPPAEIPLSHYILPYRLAGKREPRVLIVGAGSGNDAAGALRAGAKSVEAVEIDPSIVDLGRSRHPNRPYASDRVHVTIDDARAFLRRDTQTYDVVWFGLLDSHVTPSAYSNVRLDHFVYTRESIQALKDRVAPGGVVALLFLAQTRWIGDRLAGLLADAFGEPPVALMVQTTSPCLGYGGLLLMAGSRDALDGVRARIAAEPALRDWLIPPETFPLKTILTTDDWPYLYLPYPTLPRYHLLVALASLVLGVALRRRLFRPGDPVNPAMMLLGAGFMLLEVTGVSRAALLYGTTWTVNAYIVGAILSMILLANLTVALLRPDPRGWPFAGLLLSLIALALVPTAWLAGLPGAARILVGGGFLALPVYFSGIVFVGAWAPDARKDLALGSNLLGSLLGGVASLLSMLVGFQVLTFLTLAVYLGALLVLRRGPASA